MHVLLTAVLQVLTYNRCSINIENCKRMNKLTVSIGVRKVSELKIEISILHSWEGSYHLLTVQGPDSGLGPTLSSCHLPSNAGLT